MANEINQPQKGMITDVHPSSLGDNSYSYALNARQESEDGGQLYLTNEPSTTLGLKFLDGYRVIGHLNIPEVQKTFFWLANPTTGDSLIGYTSNDVSGCTDNIDYTDPATCNPCIDTPSENEGHSYSTKDCLPFTIIVSDKCLNFSQNHPIHDPEYKITNDTLELYWTDEYNPPRWIDINNVPRNPDGTLNCNLLRVFPDYSVPIIRVIDVLDTGSLKTGSYQFLVAYANAKGEELSQYYSVTNPTGVWENKIGNDLSPVTAKSIRLSVDNLDISYKHINIAVIKNVDFTQQYELVGTYDITNSHFEHTYTGNDKSPRPLTLQDVYFRSPYYNKASTVEAQNKLLMWGNLETEKRVNYQSIANRLKLFWETWRLPYSEFESYKNGAHTANIRGYMRDEVYAFDVVFLKKNGRYSDRFPIPGRSYMPHDMEFVTNTDAESVKQDPCDADVAKRAWEVYNTGWVRDTSPQYNPSDRCYIGPYQWGEFGYWESTETYPNNPDIWGELAGQPIRHHKFPDCLISPIHDNSNTDTIGYEHSIYPIGIKIDTDSLYNAIHNSNLTQAEKDDIIGIKILRSNRRVDKSIVAKGLLYNVGRYSKDGQGYFYPNYPFNDLRPDPFLSWTQPKRTGDDLPGPDAGGRFEGYSDESLSKARYTFHSPDTSFRQPPISGQLKIETCEYGKADMHIVKVEDHPKYAIGTKKGVKMATVLALTTVVSMRAGGGLTGFDIQANMDFSNFTGAFQTAYDIINKLVPLRDYAAQLNGVGNYSRSLPVYNNGNKVRNITLGGYLDPTNTDIADQLPINNYQRESSVFLRVNKSLPYTHEIGAPQDNSRFTLSDQQGGTVTTGGNPPVFVTMYKLTIEQLTFSAIWLGAIYSIWGKDFEVKQQFITYDWNKGGSNYTGFIYVVPVDGVSVPTSPTIASPIVTATLSGSSPVGIGTTAGTFTYDAIATELKLVQDGTPVVNTTTPAQFGIRSKKDISSYYAAIKQLKPDQYGQIYSYTALDTGSLFLLDNLNKPPLPTVFGGDTFINRFALKRKLPFFITNYVGLPANSDAFYNELGNVAYPTFYISSGPIDYAVDATVEDRFDRAYRIMANTSWGVVTNIISGGVKPFTAGMSAILAFVGNVIDVIGLKDINLDKHQDKGYWEEGVFYLFAYGIPYFFVESDVNVDYRHATNPTEGNYFPNVGLDIPDNWLQEKNTSIARDNTYNYSRDLSRQNINDYFQHLPSDYDPVRTNTNVHSTRVIYSEPSSLEDKQNNWLVYKANNYDDFGYTNGKLIDLRAMEQEKVLARFENNLSVYNAFITLPTDNKSAITGTGMMFKNPPQEFFKTDSGYGGTQNKAFCSTKYGYFWVDTKRGEVFQMQGGVKEVSRSGMRNFLKENLPFKILKHIPNVPVDNSYKDIGLTLAWDNRYERLFITKKDYIPLDSSILFDGESGEFKLNGQTISAKDSNYFCDASFTIAYSPLTESWVSFYSFVPDFYVEHQGHFQSGTNGSTSSLWNHLLTNKSYQIFYNEFHPFVVEPVTKTTLQSKVITSVAYRMDALRYTNSYDWQNMTDITFSNALVYNTNCLSGDLSLYNRDKSNLDEGIFAEQDGNTISIPVSRTSDIWRFNKFSDVTKNRDSLRAPFVYLCNNAHKEINENAVDYSKPFDMGRMEKLKGDWFKVRLTNNEHSRYKLIFKWLMTKNTDIIR